MIEPCGCYYGGDCTKTTVCAVDSVKEELEDRITELKAKMDAAVLQLADEISEERVDQWVLDRFHALLEDQS